MDLGACVGEKERSQGQHQSLCWEQLEGGSCHFLIWEESGRGRWRRRSRTYANGNFYKAVGYPGLTLKGQARLGEAVSFETMLRDQQESKRGVRTELWGCRMFRIHTLVSLFGLLTGVRATGGSLSSPAPAEGGGSGQVISDSTCQCYSGIHVRLRGTGVWQMSDLVMRCSFSSHVWCIKLLADSKSAGPQEVEMAGHQRDNS